MPLLKRSRTALLLLFCFFSFQFNTFLLVDMLDYPLLNKYNRCRKIHASFLHSFVPCVNIILLIIYLWLLVFYFVSKKIDINRRSFTVINNLSALEAFFVFLEKYFIFQSFFRLFRVVNAAEFRSFLRRWWQSDQSDKQTKTSRPPKYCFLFSFSLFLLLSTIFYNSTIRSQISHVFSFKSNEC